MSWTSSHQVSKLRFLSFPKIEN
ncbi:unnamed protein product [Spirodela intermedia]|uniref:Uncharacterized protein n=1 Tax=Spirodela intermedia TaxID=51605 RepID=A0A7I8LDN2_SPIIN|nr:unnamed protein product [Spirodela intermedia]